MVFLAHMCVFLLAAVGNKTWNIIQQEGTHTYAAVGNKTRNIS
jgi:hypothetical protein